MVITIHQLHLIGANVILQNPNEMQSQHFENVVVMRQMLFN